MTNVHRALIDLVIPPLLLLCFGVGGVHAASNSVKMDCGAKPLHGTRDVEFHQVWERPAESADYLIGRLADGRRDTHGNILLVDRQLKDLKVFAPDGVWLRTIGREGEGPGECDDARKVFLRPDGDIGLLQAVPGTIVWFHDDGTPAERVRIGGEPTVNITLTAGPGPTSTTTTFSSGPTNSGPTTTTAFQTRRAPRVRWRSRRDHLRAPR